MQAYGSDRFRVAGGKVILFAEFPKGWTARVPKQGTHSAHPGTAVLWDEQYYEVISATAGEKGGVTYVLAPWDEDNIFRVVEHYDEAAETRRAEDYKATLVQQKHSRLVSVLAIFFGNVPAVVQRRLGNDYGITPARMTLASVILPWSLLAGCAWFAAGGTLEDGGSPVPEWLWVITALLSLEGGVRFYIAMSQNRGLGTAWGLFLYIFIWLVAPKRWKLTSPFEVEQGTAFFMLPPEEDVARRDAIEMASIWFTLLPATDQQFLAQRYGYDYRRQARMLAVIILFSSFMGIVTMYMKLSVGVGTLTTGLSFLFAIVLFLEQILRLHAFARGPAGSILGLLVRPFAGKFLRA